jgi:hypothetical protein
MWKYLLGALALTILLGASIFGIGALEAKACRKSPHTACVTAILAHDRPDKLVARVFLFRNGRPSYMNDLRAWAYAKNTKLADSSLNRFLLERDLSAIPPVERGEWLRQYPISLNPSSVYLVAEALRAGSYQSLVASARAGQAGGELCKEWIERNLQSVGGKNIFIEAGKFTLFCSEPRPSLQLHRFWPLLSPDEKTKFLADADGGLPQDGKQLADILGWYEHDVKENTSFWMRDFLRDPATQARAFDLIKKRIANSEDESQNEELLLSLAGLSEGKGSSKIDGAVSTCLDLADSYRNSRPELALAAVETVLRNFYDEKQQPTDLDTRIVEKLSAYVGQLDSTFKKGIIVELANAHNSLANPHIDEAFTGDAPRLTFFKDIADYTASNAAVEYVRLSGHDYAETGKMYPPAGSKDYSDQAAQSWESFVGRYRWFPATDDAYYRLAYIYLAQGNYQHAVDTIRTYSQMEKVLPDTDAGDYVRQVYYEVAEKGVSVTDDEIACVRTLLRFPAAKSLTFSDYPFEEVLRAVNCVTNSEHPSVNINQRILDGIRQELTSLARVPIEQRLTVAYSLFSRGEFPFVAVFYSKFSSVHREHEEEDDWTSALELADAVDRSLTARAYTPSEITTTLIPRWIQWHEQVPDPRVRKRYKDLSAKLGVNWSSPYDEN